MTNFRNEQDNDTLQLLYKVYPVLKKIDDKNNGIIKDNITFRKVSAEEYLPFTTNTCPGFIFVIKGIVNIQKINLNGEETNLYNIESGDLCHEALSCLLNYQPLDILGKALVDSHIAILNFELVEKILLKENDFLQHMYQDIHNKFCLIVENKEKIMHEDLETRLLKLLISKDSKLIYLKHSDIALEIDSTRESVSRKLKYLEKLGYISLTRGKIMIIKDLHELLK
ncbi:Crp/Fnr family transcriptional regulator [Clostridium grantii]|uniref:CRP/FNR family transcriptional regulator, anaerobic regulatory protein n=1 Tax=Clostridium grantii DSM 8605 TaxID=1121316 RepID=A0A1M5W110_9CLOT|nr:Crp/Fnr family transcriptional regulator [Clostridium grantii]SHH81185.1 CRP/FNR family transcriptional regulator, anaerobic regulatory protein [Clostridium grantii DSM 8605]